MSLRNDKLVLGVTLGPVSAHIAGWRHPKAISNAGAHFSDLLAVAKHAEESKLDFVFFADELCAPEEEPEVLSRNSVIFRFEPLTLISALAVTTKNIGLIATQTTTYNEPYHLARKFASIDQLSNGRAGWNIVTSYLSDEAHNFSFGEHPPAEKRYERAEEFVSVTNGLWNSWDDDAFTLEKKTGEYFHPNKFRVLNHKGKYFSVRGPLNVRRPVQGRPVLVQAGSSETGREFSAKHAEVVFTAQSDMQDAINFRKDIHRRAEKYGRNASSIRIVAGIHPYIAKTIEEAQYKFDELQKLVDPKVALDRLSLMIGFDVSSLDLDTLLPDNIPGTDFYKSRQELLVKQSRDENLTVRQLSQRVASAYGHRIIIGTPETIANSIIEWFESGAIDGFVVQPPFLPDGLNDFTESVVPLLQDHGIFRKDYQGKTFRENLGK